MKEKYINYLKTNSKNLTQYVVNKLKSRIKLKNNNGVDKDCKFYSEWILYKEVMEISGWKMKHGEKEELTYFFMG